MGTSLNETVLVLVVLFGIFGSIIIGSNADLSIGIFEFDNSSCTNEAPFADPENISNYYQCFMLEPDVWYIELFTCPPGGVYEASSGSCIEDVTETSTTEASTTEAPTTTEASTTEAPTTTEASTTEAPTTTETTSEATTEVQTTQPTVATTPSRYQCTTAGIFPDPDDMTKYYRCLTINGQFYSYIHTCPTPSCFNPSSQLCTTTTSCSSSATTSASTLVTTTTPNTLPPTPLPCSSSGNFPLGSCSNTYYKCVFLGSQYIQYIFTCPPGSYFNTITTECGAGPCPPQEVTTEAATTILTTEAVTATEISTTEGTTGTDVSSSTEESTGTDISSTELATDTTTELMTTTLATTLVPTTDPLPTCSAEGISADPTDCTKYHRCVNVGGNWVIYVYQCPPSSYFSASIPGCKLGTCPTEATTIAATTIAATTIAATTIAATTIGSSPSEATTLTINTEASTTLTPLPTTIAANTTPGALLCMSAGTFPDPSNCNKYFKCVLISGTYYPYSYTCPTGSHFDLTSKMCTQGAC